MFPLFILGSIRPLHWQPAAHWSTRGKLRVRIREINVTTVNNQRLTVVLICLFFVLFCFVLFCFEESWRKAAETQFYLISSVLWFQDDNKNLRTEVATLREELSTLEAKYQDKYRHALRKNQDALADIKDNEFRYSQGSAYHPEAPFDAFSEWNLRFQIPPA